MNAQLPNAYRCALEALDGGERSQSRLNGLIDHYERVTGIASTPELASHIKYWRDTTACLAAQRYYDFKEDA